MDIQNIKVVIILNREVFNSDGYNTSKNSGINIVTSLRKLNIKTFK